MNQKRWQDWVMLVLGAWLFVSPFFLQFSSFMGASAWDSYILGVAVAVVAVVALTVPRLWEEWVNLVLGIWLIIAPFLLGFSGEASATWNHVVLGIVIGVDAIWAMADVAVHRHRTA
jgi:hypothetical protein